VRHDLVEQLTSALDEAARKKLLSFALKLVRGKTWPGETDLLELAQDITSEAVCKTVTGERRWDPEKTPCPISFLASAIKSLVSARLKNDRNSEFLRELDAPGADEIQDFRRSAHNRAEAEEFFYGLLEEVGDDEVCAKMVDLFEKGYKPEEVAEELKLTTQEIYAAKKRLIRKARAYLQKSQGG
jgi:DNA-directed RNA polymerase specialized sigma24 family protein